MVTSEDDFDMEDDLELLDDFGRPLRKIPNFPGIKPICV